MAKYIVDVPALKLFIEVSGFKQKVVAEKAGLDESGFTKLLKGRRRIEAGEYAGICDAIGVPMERFIKAGELEGNR